MRKHSTGKKTVKSTTKLGAFIREKRLGLDMSQAELVEKIWGRRGYNSYLSVIETGKRGSLSEKLTKKIAQALRCKPEELKKLLPEKRQTKERKPITELGKLIQYNRKRKGLTRKQLAEEAGMAEVSIKKIELSKKETAGYETARKLTKTLDLNLKEISKFLVNERKEAKGYVGTLIRKTRKRRLLSQSDLARIVGVSRENIRQIEERERNLSRKNQTLSEIIKKLGLEDRKALIERRCSQKSNRLKVAKRKRDSTNDPVSRFLLDKRIELGLSLEEIRRRSGLSITTILRAEEGFWTQKTLFKIEKVLNCEVLEKFEKHIKTQLLLCKEMRKQKRRLLIKKRKSVWGRFFTEKRLARKLTQKEVAAESGINLGFYVKIEKGDCFPVSKILEKLLMVLECEMPSEIILQFSNSFFKNKDEGKK